MPCNVVLKVIFYFFFPEMSKLSLEEIGGPFGDQVVVHLTDDGHGILEDEKSVTRGLRWRRSGRERNLLEAKW